ncbi:UNVERIFIED_CONTAM: hypothetical protein FKN15_054260 [Acipenser sinensis]
MPYGKLAQLALTDQLRNRDDKALWKGVGKHKADTKLKYETPAQVPRFISPCSVGRCFCDSSGHSTSNGIVPRLHTTHTQVNRRAMGIIQSHEQANWLFTPQNSRAEVILSHVGLASWRERMVGFGADGDAVMPGITKGLAAVLKQDFPWMIPVHCMAHRLEPTPTDVIREEKQVKGVIDLLENMYKIYKASPKMWRELREVAELLHTRAHKPTRVQGTRWLAHIHNARQTLVHNFAAIVVHLENVVKQKRGSIDIQGKARHALKFFMLNVLECLSRFSLKLQEDSLTLDEVVHAMDTTLMTLQNMNSHNGPKLQEFLQEVIGNQLKGVELRVSQEDDQPFLNLRSRVIKALTSHLEERFQSLKSNQVLSAAAVMDPRKWPSDRDELVSHGKKAVAYLCEHFKQVLSSNGCSMEEVMFEWMAAKVHIIDTPRSQWCNVWKDMFAEPILQNRFSNLLHLIELSLVIPLSTEECERGFSCMKRLKSDWRSSLSVDMLSKLMFIFMNGPSQIKYDAAGAVNRRWRAGERARRPDYMKV